MTTFEIEPDFYTPPDFTGSTDVIMPDSVVVATAAHFGLTGMPRGLDPACGSYTIPRTLREQGAPYIDASDIDPDNCRIARHEAQLLLTKGKGLGRVACSDMTELISEEPYDYIYTSLPFSWFDALGDRLNPTYAKALHRLLKPSSLLIIDSTMAVERDSVTIEVARNQTEYLSANGFQQVEQLDYKVSRSAEGFDTNFTELAFIRR